MVKATSYTPPALHLELPLRPSSPFIPVLRPAPTPAPQEQPNFIGEMLGNFRLTKLLGQGGMGVVYLGEHIEIHKQVAIKILKSELTQNPELTARFFRETRLLSRLQHPSIVAAYDGGFDPRFGRYLVMEYLDGENLQQYLARQGALSPFEAVSIAYQLLDALEVIHEAGILHRDIKPANIYLMRSKRGLLVKLLDFGISKFLTPTDDLKTATGIVVGTPLYLSPEQAIGKRDLDARADLYSVGAVLYEMITGRKPFTARTPQRVLRMQQTEPPASPSLFAPGLSLALEELILQSLKKSPAERPQSAQELREALRALLPSLPQRPLSSLAKEQEREPLADLFVDSEESLASTAGSLPRQPALSEELQAPKIQVAPSQEKAQPKQEKRAPRPVLWAYGVAASVLTLAAGAAAFLR
jgi:serine/threonine protein kinase